MTLLAGLISLLAGTARSFCGRHGAGFQDGGRRDGDSDQPSSGVESDTVTAFPR